MTGTGSPDADVIVIGAGVAGLTVALDLAEAGRRVLVLEAEPEVGGCVRLHRVAGIALDRGADSFALSRPAVGNLAARLDLATEVPLGGGAWVHHARGAAPLPAGTLLGIPAHPLAADVRRAVGLPGAVRAALGDWRRRRPGPVTGSLGEIVRRRMGESLVTRLVEPIAAGVYSATDADLELDAVAPGLRAKLAAGQTLHAAVADLRRAAPPAGSAARGITGGMGTLPPALAERARAAGAEIRCGVRVLALRRVGDRWELDVRPAAGPTAGEGRPTAADGPTAGADRRREGRPTAGTVVVATQAPVAADLLARATDGAAALPVAEPAAVALVTLVVAGRGLDRAPRGSGVLVAPRTPGVAAKALTHVTAKWAWAAQRAGVGRHVLRLSYGRGPVPDAASARVPGSASVPGAGAATGRAAGTDSLSADSDDDRLVAAARRDAARLLGTTIAAADVIDAAVVRYPDRLVAPRAGRGHEIAAFRTALAAFPGLAVVGASVAGTGLAAVVTDATATALAIAAGAGCTMEP